MGCGSSQEEYPSQGAPTGNGAAGMGVAPLRTQSASSRVVSQLYPHSVTFQLIIICLL